MTRLNPVHPGEVLKHDFMEPLGLSATALAKAVGVTPARINEIVRGRRGITAETALRLARYTKKKEFQHRCPELDEPSGPLRARDCGAGQGRIPPRNPSARGGVRESVRHLLHRWFYGRL